MDICPKKSETVYRPIWGILKLSGVVNQKRLELSIRDICTICSKTVHHKKNILTFPIRSKNFWNCLSEEKILKLSVRCKQNSESVWLEIARWATFYSPLVRQGNFSQQSTKYLSYVNHIFGQIGVSSSINRCFLKSPYFDIWGAGVRGRHIRANSPDLVLASMLTFIFQTYSVRRVEMGESRSVYVTLAFAGVALMVGGIVDLLFHHLAQP